MGHPKQSGGKPSHKAGSSGPGGKPGKPSHKGGSGSGGGRPDKNAVGGKRKRPEKPHPAAPGDGRTYTVKKEAPAKKPSKPGKEGGGAPPKKKIPLNRAEARKDKREKKRARQSDTVIEANQLSRVPIKQIPAAERQAKIGQILDRLKGDFAELAMRRDTTRVLQNMIKYGGVQHKTRIIEGLKGNMVKLALHRHGVWLLLKILQHGKDSFTQAIAEEIFPELVRVAFHSTGAQLVDYLFMMDGQDRGVTTRRRVNMLLYFLGPEYRVFDTKLDRFTPQVLEAALLDIVGFAADHLKADRREVFEQLFAHLQKAAGKQQLMFRFNHALLASWMRAADRTSDKFTEFVTGELHTQVLALRGTPTGVAVACELVRIADAKGRKHIAKSLGETEQLAGLAMDTHGWRLLAALLHYTDDTVLLRKKVLKGLPVMDILASKSGCQLFLWILCAGKLGPFSQQDIEVLLGEVPAKQKPAPAAAAGKKASGNGKAKAKAEPAEDKESLRLALVTANMQKYSKKDYASRRAELLDEVFGKLLETFAESPELVELALSDRGPAADLLCEVAAEAQLRLAAKDDAGVRAGLSQLVDAVAACCAQSVRRSYLGEEAMQDEDEEKKAGDADSDDDDSSDDEDEDEDEEGSGDEQDGDEEQEEAEDKFEPQKFERVQNRLMKNALKNKQHALAAEEGERGCILDTLAHFTVKRLLAGLRGTKESEVAGKLAGGLWEQSFAVAPEQLLQSGRACFVLKEMVELASEQGLKAQLKEILAGIRTHRKVLESADRPGCKVLLEVLQKHK